MVTDLYSSPCPCGQARSLSACCARYWTGTLVQTPEQLMRARYSAFATGQLDFLLQTLHPSRRQIDEMAQLEQSQKTTQWLRLWVLKAVADRVEFTAFFSQNGVIGQLHERSRFVLEQGSWWYLDGEFLPPLKWQRNDPCWCGAAQKYKKCHGAKG
jgi:SEC-C motif domain protein